MSRDSTTIATASIYNNASGGNTRVFRFNSANTSGSSTGTWEQRGNMVLGDGGEYSGFDVSVSADGSTIATGAVGWNSYQGRTKLYSYASATSTWVAKGSPILGTTSSRNGYSVSLSNNGKRIGMGEVAADSNSGQAGVYFYDGA
jgi:hypothetical protein